MKLTITVPPKFNFWRTVYSHGWCSLPPFSVDKDAQHLSRTVQLPSGKIVTLKIGSASPRRVSIEVNGKIGADERTQIVETTRACLRLDEDFSEFYAEAMKYPRFRWIPSTGAGRMLRTPTVFEDIVKMICTTNCSWALTGIMVGNLCTKLGTQSQGRETTFPAPEAIAGCSEKFLRKEIRAGYRAPYLLELSRRIVRREIDLELWRQCDTPTAELFEEVRTVKGVGPYAAGNILKLLGRYDYLGIDSWCRKKFFDLHKDGRIVSDKAIGKFYASLGKWQGLFFWMDVTKEWYSKKIPF